MMKKLKIKEITILLEVISKNDLEIIYNNIYNNNFSTDLNNNSILENWDAPSAKVLEDSRKKIKHNIEQDFSCSVSKEGLGTLVKVPVGWELRLHYDQSSNLPTYSGEPSRDISSILYISDMFTGGELEFPELDIVIEPVAGSAIYFPGTKDYMHAVKPVIAGERMTFTGFWGILPT